MSTVLLSLGGLAVCAALFVFFLLTQVDAKFSEQLSTVRSRWLESSERLEQLADVLESRFEEKLTKESAGPTRDSNVVVVYGHPFSRGIWRQFWQSWPTQRRTWKTFEKREFSTNPSLVMDRLIAREAGIAFGLALPLSKVGYDAIDPVIKVVPYPGDATDKGILVWFDTSVENSKSDFPMQGLSSAKGTSLSLEPV
ncbi:MAG: hypothetical protein QOG04_236 [Actinomycetota bacterium]|jgi:hypothetical protein|nr:hypothetical protein [Actinomycetota bacterium]